MEQRHIIFKPYVKVYYPSIEDMRHNFSSVYRGKFGYKHVYLNFGHTNCYLDSGEVHEFITIRKEVLDKDLEKKLFKCIPVDFKIEQSIEEDGYLTLVFDKNKFKELYTRLTGKNNEIYEKTIHYNLISPIEEKYHGLEEGIYYKLLKKDRSGIDYVKLYSHSPNKIDIHILITGLNNKTDKYKNKLKTYISERLGLDNCNGEYYNPNTTKYYNKINVLYYKDIDINQIYNLETLIKMKG